jgi:hypothetical protein
MLANGPQRTKWSDLQCNKSQSFDDPNGSAEHGRDVNAPEKNDSQKIPQVDVSENICEERCRQKNKPDFGNRSDCSPNATVGFNSFPRRVPAPKHPDKKDRRA